MLRQPSRRAAGFEECFTEVWPRAVAVARRILGDATAEDAASEAFARALARWPKVGSLPYRDAWVLRVTGNVAIDMARRRERAARLAPSGEGTRASVEDDVATRLALVAALHGLPRRQREVIVLRYLADLTEPAVAEGLGVSLGTVQQHAHRGVRALRERLGEEVQLDVP